MIQVFSQTHERLCLLQGYKTLKIRQKLADGDKELSFQYPRSGVMAGYLKNENYIQTQEDEFVLTEISGGKEWRKYTAILNLEDLKGKSFVSFETIEKTVTECLTTALDGTGWSVGKCNVTKRRTIRKDNVCTALDIIDQCCSTYKIEIEYQSRSKIINLYEQIGSDKGAYFMESLNLRQTPSMTSSSSGLYTQIRPIGKNGLRINVNGKDYIENHSYSPKNIMLTWKDERYTVASSLLEDATLKLAEICKPTQTYEVDVIDLASQSELYKEIFSYEIGDIVTLVSKTENIKEKMRIAVIDKYPDNPQNNTCQLSTAKKTFVDVQKEVKEEAVAEAIATAAVNTSRFIENESGITSEEIQLEIEGIKTEIMEDISERYLMKEKAEELTQESAIAAAKETEKSIDKRLEDYVTAIQEKRNLETAKQELLSNIKEDYITKEKWNSETEKIDRKISEVQKDFDEKLAEAEKTKNNFTDIDGTIWRLSVENGCLHLEELEMEE